MSVTLAVDASVTGTTGCAVAAGSRHAALEVGQGAAEALAGSVRRALAALDLELRDVRRVIVGVGPGSFTGIRSAVTFANAVGFANGAAVHTAIGLEAIAYEQCADGETVAVAMEAGRGRSYVAAYGRDGGALAPVCAPATVEQADLDGRVARLGVQRLVVLEGVPVPSAGLPVVRLRRRGPDPAAYLRVAGSIGEDAPSGALPLYLGPPLRPR